MVMFGIFLVYLDCTKDKIYQAVYPTKTKWERKKHGLAERPGSIYWWVRHPPFL